MKVKPFKIFKKDREHVIKILKENIDINICGCWLWKGRIVNGYASIRLPGRNGDLWAHRVSYAVFNGPIKKDHVIDHDCRNPSCIRPDHLVQVTHQVNCKKIHERKTRDRQRSIFEIQPEIFTINKQLMI